MSVHEVIEQIRAMSPAELAAVQAALDELQAVPAQHDVDPQTYRRGLAAWERLMNGVCEGGGRHLSANLDESIYRADR